MILTIANPNTRNPFHQPKAMSDETTVKAKRGWTYRQRVKSPIPPHRTHKAEINETSKYTKYSRTKHIPKKASILSSTQVEDSNVTLDLRCMVTPTVLFSSTSLTKLLLALPLPLIYTTRLTAAHFSYPKSSTSTP
ncbi:hypothetical protein J1614_011334 [Plenodomus biglobosus]|nr:hypothetical protein J1614_011334 [Plenodomus biglobosus]